MKIKFKDLQTGDVAFERDLLPSQEAFWRSTERFVLMSGGVGCGKSTIMLLKIIFDAMSQDNNYILVGRESYTEVHDVLLKEFFELCQPSWIKEYRKTPHPTVILHTFGGKTSEIIFRNLDKFSKQEILGLNLGGFAVDQAETLTEEMFMGLKGRLRRPNIMHRGYLTINPQLTWLYRAFKQAPEVGHRLIEASTLENEKNLPAEYIADLKNQPEGWYRQYVLGIWDESLLSNNTVFAREHIEALGKHVHSPIREVEGLKIFREFQQGHRYQIGVDSAEGADRIDEIRNSDWSVIKVWDHTLDEEAASYSSKVPPRVLGEKAIRIANMYGKPMMVPEMNSIGYALVDYLDMQGYPNIYRRKEYDKTSKKTLQKNGWRMTSSTKTLLIAHFEELLRKRSPKVYSATTVEQFKTFVWSNEAKKKGAGAATGLHDDELIALMLAAFDEGEVTSRVKGADYNKRDMMSIPTTPSIELVNGRYLPPPAFRDKREAKWTKF